MKDEHVANWNLSDEFLLDAAEKRIGRGDYFGALSALNRRTELYGPSADAWAFYADVYEALELWELAADAWFRFLDVCNEADFSEGYEGLAIVFMNMGNDLQSAFYYRKVSESEGYPDIDMESFLLDDEKPSLHIVGDSDPETLREGLDLLKSGELEAARSRLLEMDRESPDFPSAAGLASMCSLMLGNEDEAEAECRELLKTHPDNVQALTTYCAVLGARGNKEGAKEVARQLSGLKTEGTDDMYRIATALCETGLHEEAAKCLTELKERLPFDENVLFFHAVACYNTDRLDDAIDSLERLTTLNPRKVIAAYYLEQMRMVRDGETSRFRMNYFYRIPPDEYRTVANFLLVASNAKEEESEKLAALPELGRFFRIAFDEMEGRDEKLQLLAVKVAAKTRSDDFLREVLLDYTGDEIMKLEILHELTVRNEDNSFGTVMLDMYREFYTHHIDIGERKAQPFLLAFADVYSKYGLLGETNEGKLCGAAEDIYRALEFAEAWDLFDEREALSAAIYREARLKDGVRSMGEICEMFEANRFVAEEILDFLM